MMPKRKDFDPSDVNASSDDHIIIEGVKENGDKFRPSDWVDRIAALGAEYGPDRRLRYTKELSTTSIQGQKCLRLDLKLKETNEELYKMVVCFAEENKLRIKKKVAKAAAEQTCAIDPEASLQKKP